MLLNQPEKIPCMEVSYRKDMSNRVRFIFVPWLKSLFEFTHAKSCTETFIKGKELHQLPFFNRNIFEDLVPPQNSPGETYPQ